MTDPTIATQNAISAFNREITGLQEQLRAYWQGRERINAMINVTFARDDVGRIIHSQTMKNERKPLYEQLDKLAAKYGTLAERLRVCKAEVRILQRELDSLRRVKKGPRQGSLNL